MLDIGLEKTVLFFRRWVEGHIDRVGVVRIVIIVTPFDLGGVKFCRQTLGVEGGVLDEYLRSGWQTRILGDSRSRTRNR